MFSRLTSPLVKRSFLHFPLRSYSVRTDEFYKYLNSSTDTDPTLEKDPMFHAESEGKIGTKNYRVIVIKNTPGMVDLQRASPYFAIPLWTANEKGLLHMVCEIPKNTVEKMEVTLCDPDHAIVQDVNKDGTLRVYKHGPMPWNYGMLPQTYEDEDDVCSRTNLPKDGDALDVVEIGSTTLCTGEVIKIKPLGALPLVDQGEIDWKIIAINAKDELAPALEDITDVEAVLPGVLSEVKEWFRVYKLAEGKKENTFALEGNYLNKEATYDIIAESYENLFELLPKLYAKLDEDNKENELENRKIRRKQPPNIF